MKKGGERERGRKRGWQSNQARSAYSVAVHPPQPQRPQRLAAFQGHGRHKRKQKAKSRENERRGRRKRAAAPAFHRSASYAPLLFSFLFLHGVALVGETPKSHCTDDAKEKNKDKRGRGRREEEKSHRRPSCAPRACRHTKPLFFTLRAALFSARRTPSTRTTPETFMVLRGFMGGGEKGERGRRGQAGKRQSGVHHAASSLPRPYGS